jgi:site-specific DNA-methyltransferase (adenine-specific)
MQKTGLLEGDCLDQMKSINDKSYQLIIADPPYFQVLVDESWDNQWKDEKEYLDWSMQWISECGRLLKDDGLFYIFGQLGKREHAWLHLMSQATRELQFHDLIIWDRIVGYNERYDSFTPSYEMILVLRKSNQDKPYFNKDAVRLAYDEKTIETYLKDKRYKDKDARREHLNKGKYSTNIIRTPSLKGVSKEKVGHPSQKTIKLIQDLILSSSKEGDHVFDPFLGSGTTAYVAQQHKREWTGIEKNKDYIDIIKKRVKGI